MPFGKFRGVEVEDLPADYLDWLMTLDDALAKQRHPDVGGDVEAMRRLNEAVTALREHIERSTAAESVA